MFVCVWITEVHLEAEGIARIVMPKAVTSLIETFRRVNNAASRWVRSIPAVSPDHYIMDTAQCGA